ncbi:uridine-cytidine kinase 2-A-like isoform X2 [Paramacrobiotus metropolitanus]|uniref:uridine-cytidine kinase 2-A-like isoform X2 n=1 Tax=Paramacrobiotus metropolitanus TaxID=2943436 RepID=UPI002445F106|nr:uridine-cytidine kinase 2-A-like isoform X2 [Paramacrobiotus metropolitanus]
MERQGLSERQALERAHYSRSFSCSACAPAAESDPIAIRPRRDSSLSASASNFSWPSLSSMALMNGLHLDESQADDMPVALHHVLPPSPAPQHATPPVNGVANGHAHHNGQSSVLENGDVRSGAPAQRAWKPFLIGVAGGTASGKTSVCRKIMQKMDADHLEHGRVITISADSFYRVLSKEEREQARIGEFNFDHPDALDYPLILQTMRTILSNQVAEIPVYDFVTHSRRPGECVRVCPADVLLFEGILVFYFPELRNMFQLKLFVDIDADTRLARRVVRDIAERGRDLPSVIHQYTLFVKPAFEEFCQPTKKYADVIIPRGAENEVAINLIVQHIREHLLPLAASENGSPRRASEEAEPPLTPETALPNGLAEKTRILQLQQDNGQEQAYAKKAAGRV